MAAQDGGERAHAAALLPDHRLHHHIAPQADARRLDRADRADPRDQAALHIRRAAPVEAAVRPRRAEGRIGPDALVTGGHDIDVAVDGDGSAAARACEDADDIRATGEGRLLRDIFRVVAEVGVLRLPDIHVHTHRAQHLRHQVLHEPFLAGDARPLHRRLDAGDGRLEFGLDRVEHPSFGIGKHAHPPLIASDPVN